jgi:hypothetical protein
MADPFSISAGVITVVTAALQSSKSLYETVQSFRHHDRTVRGLLEEVAALVNVLESLKDAIDSNNSIISLLENPVRQCSQICREFEELLLKCSSSGPRTSFRGWAKMKYMAGDIRNFTDTLAVYKSTIAIVLGSVTM